MKKKIHIPFSRCLCPHRQHLFAFVGENTNKHWWPRNLALSNIATLLVGDNTIGVRKICLLSSRHAELVSASHQKDGRLQVIRCLHECYLANEMPKQVRHDLFLFLPNTYSDNTNKG